MVIDLKDNIQIYNILDLSAAELKIKRVYTIVMQHIRITSLP